MNGNRLCGSYCIEMNGNRLCGSYCIEMNGNRLCGSYCIEMHGKRLCGSHCTEMNSGYIIIANIWINFSKSSYLNGFTSIYMITMFSLLN